MKRYDYKCNHMHYFPKEKEIECYNDEGVLMLTNVSPQMALSFAEKLIRSVRTFSEIRVKESE